MKPRIVVDENIPLAREVFGVFGEVTLASGRKIDARVVAPADILIVRSVTRVDEALLAGSRVRFVGTATIGTDHVDRAYLERRAIAFASAPGCNARSVAEYVVAALLELEVDLQRDWRGRTIGVVGVGNVGRRVAQLAAVLGLEVLSCDPPRAALEPEFVSVPLARILAEADVVTIHVPLTRRGEHATHHLLGAAEIARLRPGAVVFNSSRGGVVDDTALAGACAARRAYAVLDVWETEPDPLPALLDVVRLATPHIAGYSLDGKIAGTRMIADALRDHLGSTTGPSPGIYDAPVAAPRIAIAAQGRDAVRAAVRHAYAIRADDERLRGALARASGTRGEAFDRLRRDYPVRREFASYTVAGSLGESERTVLRALGFEIADASGALRPAVAR
jgi:erythronate-4-phosphate dehydrogenase